MKEREDGDEEDGVEEACETVGKRSLAKREASERMGRWQGERTYPSINCISALSSSTTLTFKRMTYTA